MDTLIQSRSKILDCAKCACFVASVIAPGSGIVCKLANVFEAIAKSVGPEIKPKPESITTAKPSSDNQKKPLHCHCSCPPCLSPNQLLNLNLIPLEANQPVWK